MPPRFSSPPASNIVTSKPWPTQCAADVTPVIPAPMMATLGLRSGLLLSGGAGDRILSVKYWKSWNQNRKGWNNGFSTLDSEGMLRSAGGSNWLRLGHNVGEMDKKAVEICYRPPQLYTAAMLWCARERQHWPVIVAPLRKTTAAAKLSAWYTTNPGNSIRTHDVICRGACWMSDATGPKVYFDM